jgi:hypothetical protein
MIFGTSIASAQSPSPSPANEGNYTVRSSIEIGYRWRDVNGDENKYRSDLNYRDGFRAFDSSFFIQKNKDTGGIFDEALVTTSGWGGDPTGMFRASIGKAGAYKFDANIRRVRYFNDLFNFVNFLHEPSSQHNANITHNFGDFDTVIFPESEKLRIKIGYSYNRSSGFAGYAHRAYSDEFGVESEVDAGSDDFRFGAEGKWLGFNMGLNYGHRDFRDRTKFFLPSPSLGNTTTNNARLDTFNRTYPIDGDTDYVNYFLQRTFAKKFDVTARIIYSFSDSHSTIEEAFSGRNNSNQQTSDVFQMTANAKRSQKRGDLGVTWRATDDFRISNTLSFDDFDISGSNVTFAQPTIRTAAGVLVSSIPDNDVNSRATSYRKYSNLIEGDYQFGSRFAVNIGYRYTHRQVALWGFDRDLDPLSTVFIDESSENNTNTVIAGFKAKPVKNWSIFGDVEHGSADNFFTRLGNNDLTNYRIRSIVKFDKFTFNVSAFAKRNDIPAQSIIDPTRDYITQVRSRNFSTSLDWDPTQEFSLSGGYTFQYITSIADIRVPLGVPGQTYSPGVSEFYVRDSYYFVDATVNLKRVAFFGSYRFDDDNGQGSRPIPPSNSANIITSYPMQMHSPEFRVAIKLTRNIDWNFGYQYYKYKDIFTPQENYNAHLPYTSVRFYFGRSADRY